MKKAILYGTLCLSVNASAQDTTYFAQDFDDWEDRNFRTWSQHNDSTVTTDNKALPHVKFNHIRGGPAKNAILDATYDLSVIDNRSLKVLIPRDESYARSISYYLGGQVVRGDAAVDTTWKGGRPIRDSFVPDNDEMYLRYHIKLDPSWVFEPAGAKAHVVKIPGLAGTHKSGSGRMWPQDPDSLGWSARMLAGRGPGYTEDEWSPISYVYHLDQECGNTDHSCGHGDHIPSNSDGVLQWDLLPLLQMDQWYRIEQRIKMNDPNNGPGQGNGLIEVWINGEKDPDLCNYQLRYTTADTIGINRLWADVYYGGRYESPADNNLFLDNFHVSTGPTPWSGKLAGDSEWSDTIHVDGDVIVPDGMTLTINAGTVIEFQPGHDRHQFSAGETGVNNRSEIFVYGTLLANGTATDSVRFQRSGTAADNDAWGGIRKMDGGSVTLHHTEIRDTLPGRPTDLQAERGDGQATLRWTKPNHVGITKWKHRPGTISGTDTTWAPWQAIADSDEDPWNPLEDSLCPTCEPIPEPTLADLTVPESSEGAVGGLAGLTSDMRLPWPQFKLSVVDAAVVSADTSDQKSPSVAERVALKLLHGTVWATAFGVGAGAGGAALFIDDDHGFGVAVGAISGLFLGSVAGSAFGVNKVDPQDRFIVPLAGSLGGIVAGILAVPPKTSGPELWSLFWPLVASPVAGATLASELWRNPATSSKPHPSGVSIGLKLEPKGCVSGFAELRF